MPMRRCDCADCDAQARQKGSAPGARAREARPAALAEKDFGAGAAQRATWPKEPARYAVFFFTGVPNFCLRVLKPDTCRRMVMALDDVLNSAESPLDVKDPLALNFLPSGSKFGSTVELSSNRLRFLSSIFFLSSEAPWSRSCGW